MNSGFVGLKTTLSSESYFPWQIVQKIVMVFVSFHPHICPALHENSVYASCHQFDLRVKTLLDPTSSVHSFYKELLNTCNVYHNVYQWSTKAGKIPMLINSGYSLVGKIDFDQIFTPICTKLYVISAMNMVLREKSYENL